MVDDAIRNAVLEIACAQNELVKQNKKMIKLMSICLEEIPVEQFPLSEKSRIEIYKLLNS